jgi:hypothetical protein
MLVPKKASLLAENARRYVLWRARVVRLLGIVGPITWSCNHVSMGPRKLNAKYVPS